MWYDRLCVWYTSADRQKRGSDDFSVLIPRSLMQQAIRAAAKEEGRADQFPWETGAEYDKRIEQKG